MKTIGLWSGVLLWSVLCLLHEEGAKKLRRNRLLHSGWLTNLPARFDHVRVESSCCCYPRELVNFVCPRELVSFDPWHVTRSPPIGKRIWVGRYKKVCYWVYLSSAERVNAAKVSARWLDADWIHTASHTRALTWLNICFHITVTASDNKNSETRKHVTSNLPYVTELAIFCYV